MALAYAIDPARSIVLLRGWGTLTDADVFSFFRALRADPAFAPDFRELVDYRGVTDDRLTSSGIRTFAEATPFGPGSRRAVLTKTAATYGMVRMFQLVAGERRGDVEVFEEEVDAALRWLGVLEWKADLLATLAQAPPLSTP